MSLKFMYIIIKFHRRLTTR